MKEYTLFEAVQKLVQCINGQQIKIVSVDKEAEDSHVSDVRCFGVNVFHKHKSNNFYTLNNISVLNGNEISGIIDIRTIAVLAPYFKVKPIAASKFQIDGDNINGAICDEVVSTEWVDMPVGLLSAWVNLTNEDTNYALGVISYDLSSYLDYVNFNGLLSLFDVNAGICYVLGFDVACLKDQSIIDAINLSPYQRLCLPISIEYSSSDDDSINNFVVMSDSKTLSVFPANDDVSNNLIILPLTQQTNGVDGLMSLCCIPDLDLKIIGITYKYTSSIEDDSEPAILAP